MGRFVQSRPAPANAILAVAILTAKTMTLHDTQHSDHSRIAPGEIAIGVIIGRASEFFDFFVYGIASVLVFPSVFFPFARSLEGTLYAFVIFAFAFIARPIGSVLFMAIQRRYGRETKLTIALSFLLGISTAGIAFLPGYASLGELSIVLLSVFRIGQGIALGGSWDGLPSLLALNAPQARRGWYAMLGQIGAPGRLHGRQWIVCAYLYSSSPSFGRLPRLGLALSVLRRFCDQRRRAVREAATGRNERICALARRARARAHERRCRGGSNPGQHVGHRCLRSARKLCVVSPGHGISAVLDPAVFEPIHQRVPGDPDDWCRTWHRGHHRLRNDRGPFRPAPHARQPSRSSSPYYQRLPHPLCWEAAASVRIFSSCWASHYWASRTGRPPAL